ncbi:MAG: Hydroxyacylglutathione hydrolase [Proteobacteria bacterium]|nr:MAG: Hydroxyacylglutathione hydrolase [Pseudomonadota bacterium]
MLKVEIVKSLQNNYIFVLTCTQTGKTSVVDPSQALEVEEHLNGKRVDIILNTHQHDDHCYGIKELVEKHHCHVYCPVNDIKDGIGAVKYVEDRSLLTGLRAKDTINIGEVQLEVMEIPGHTMNHIAYFVPSQNLLFSGDTLFAAGCGNTFDGDVEALYNTLNKFKFLPKDTKVFCSHEYTLNNIEFALREYPQLETLKSRYENAKVLLANNIPLVPLHLSEELFTNPFLLAPDLEFFKDLRAKKDKF